MRRFIGIVFLTLALLQLGFRGMQRMRNDVPLWDFASVYSASRTWMHGNNPYALADVVKTWQATGLYSDRDVSYFATVYPPTSLISIIPLAVLPAGAAMIAWLVIIFLLLAMQYLALADLAQIDRHDPRMLILIGASLAAAPLQFGILAGQFSLPAISMCIIGFWAVGRGRDRLAGVLLGLAFALKPQIGAPFIAYYLVLRRLRVAEYGVLVGALIWLIALVAVKVSHLDLIGGWTQSVAATTEIGAVNDYGWTGTFRDEIVDLKMLLVSIVQNPLVLRVLVGAMVAALLAWYVSVFPRNEPRSERNEPRSELDKPRTGRRELLALAGLSAISLLPVYHRVYDVTLLTTALAWALAELDGRRRGYAVGLLVVMLVFLIPFDVVKSVGNRVPHLAAMAKTPWWQTLIAPHYAWGLLALTVGILLTMTRERRSANEPASTPSLTSPNPQA